MADRSLEKVARDLSSDFSALRDDLRRLTDVVSDLVGEQASSGRGSVSSAVDRARDRLADVRDRASDLRSRVSDHVSGVADRVANHAGEAGDRVRGASAELESRIERNPLAAVMLAVVGGLLIGALSRGRR